jgi:hypothetical protein
MKMKDRARGEEKKLQAFILALERCSSKQSLLGYHFDSTRDFVKVN